MSVRFNMKPLDDFVRGVLTADKSSGRSPGISKAFKQWGEVYRSFTQERFSTFSRGGGDWPKLKPATIARRRKGTGKTVRAKGRKPKTVAAGTVSILWDTGTLIGGLDPTLNVRKGGIEKDIPGGITVGFGGPAQHPKAKIGIAQLAGWHHSGAGYLPKREIIVKPPARVIERMRQLAENALGDEWKKATA